MKHHRCVFQLTVACAITLMLAAYGSAQPLIQVSPDSLSFGITYGGSSNANLSLGNAGTDTLHVTLSVMRRIFSIPRINESAIQQFDPELYTAPTPPGGVPGARIPALPLKTEPFTRTSSRAGGIRVLIAAADNASNISSLLLAYDDIDAVDYFYTGVSTPTIDQLRNYDVVVSWANNYHADPAAMGNVLADYIDGGGGVVLLTFSFYSQTTLGIGGRLITDGYSPFTSAEIGNRYSYAQIGVYNAQHPIMSGVSAARDYYRDYVHLTAGADLLASWDDGEEFVALKDRVVGINSYVGDSRIWTGDIGLIVHNAVTYVAKPAWLSLSATTGAVAPGGNLNIDVSANAVNLYGGLYDAMIRIASNDSLQPETDVPVHLAVTGVPSLVVSVDTLRFGTYYLGYPDTLSFTISNSGTDSLRISSLNSSDLQCVPLIATPFAIGVNRSVSVDVLYARSGTGNLNAAITIVNNDSTQLGRQVVATGGSILPPVIGTNPDSVSLIANVEDSASTILQIQNTGATDLQWSITNVVAPSAPDVLTSVISSLRKRGDPSVLPAAAAMTGVAGEQSDRLVADVRYPAASAATSRNIALLGADVSSYLNDVSSLLLGTGEFASVSIINVNVVTPTLEELQTFDAVLVWSDYGFQNPVLLGDVLADYVDGGGGVVTAVFAGSYYLEGRFNTQNYWAIAPSYTTSGQAVLGAVHVPSHPVMEGIASFNGGNSSYRYVGDVVSGARRIADWSDGYPLVAERVVNDVARIDLGFFPPSSNMSSGYWQTATDGARLMANALRFVGRKFLAFTPAAGTLGAGGSVNVSLVASAVGLVGGTYRDAVRIASNDPASPRINVPVEFRVSGIPNIVASTDTVDFGSGFVTYPDTLSFTLFNTGNDSLYVTGFSSPNAELSVIDAVPFALGVNRNKVIRVRYSRATVADLNASISIVNSDPDTGVFNIAVLGTTVLPPVINVSPTVIPTVAITSGDSVLRSVAVSNTGSTPLLFTTGISGLGGSGLPAVSPASGIMPVLRALQPASRLMPSPVRLPKRKAEEADVPAKQQPSVRTLRTITLPVTLMDTLGYSWDIASSGRITDGTNDAFDGGFRFSGFGGFSTAETEEGGREIVIGPYEYDSVSIFRKIFVPTNAAFVRYLEVLSNPTTSMKSITVSIFSYLGSDGNEEFCMTSSGDTILTTDDAWVVTDDIQNADRPAVSHVFAGEGGLLSPSSVYGGAGQGYIQFDYSLDLHPGSEMIIMHFGTQRFNGAEGVASAEALARMGGVALAGMSKGELGHVMNFAVPLMFGSTPLAGSIAPGLVDSIYAIYDADSVVTGIYSAAMDIFSNDPATPLVQVELRASVTGIPDIFTSVDTLDFSEGFIGYPDTLTIGITNAGTDSLTVQSTNFSNAAFSLIESTPFTLRVGAKRTVRVRYDRSFIADVADSLSILSNDPDEPVYRVVLLGSTVPIPEISVVPESLAFSVKSGDSSSAVVTLRNTGAGTLTWRIPQIDSAGINPALEAAAASMRARAVEPAPAATKARVQASVQQQTWTPAAAVVVRYAPSPQAGAINVALVAADYYEYVSDVQAKMISSGLFASVTTIAAESVTPTLEELNAFSAVLVWRNYGFANGTLLGNVLADYVDGGGGVVTAVFAGDGYSIGGRFSSGDYWAIVPANITYGSASLGTVNFPDHPVMAGVTSFNGGYDSYRYGTTVRPEAVRIADWSDGQPLIAYRLVSGSNRIDLGFFPPSSSVGGSSFWDASTDGATIMANALLFAGNQFVSVSPLGGTLASGGSQDLTVKVSAEHFIAGLYTKDVNILSNDPTRPVVRLQVAMSVNGNPTVELSTDSLLFGDGFINYPDTLLLTVSNRGTGELLVSDVAFTTSEFSLADSSAFTVRINESRDVRVRTARSVLGLSTGIMTLTTNDTLNPAVDVFLSSSTLDPPVFVLDPDSIRLSLAADSSITRIITIGNTGVTDLEWNARIHTFSTPIDTIAQIVESMKRRASRPLPDGVKGTDLMSGDVAWNPDSAIVFGMTAGTGQPNIALLAADGSTSITDVRTKLLASGKFSSVTSIQINAVTPTFEELLAFDAVLVWTNSGVQNPTAFGNALADYVDAGGGVVTAVWAASPGYIDGRFSSQNYWVIGQSYVTSGAASIGARTEPSHPVLEGVLSFNGGSSSYRYQGGIVTGARRIADWTDGTPLIAERIINGTSRIDLGFYPVSSSVSSGLWQASTDGVTILANALRYVGKAFVTVLPSEGTIAGSSSQDVTLTVAATGLKAGLYENRISVETNDPATPARSTDVLLTVLGMPFITVIPDSLDFGDGFAGEVDTLSFNVHNGGSDLLNVTGMSVTAGGFQILDSTSFTLEPLRSRTIRVRFARTVTGLSAGTISISSNDTTAPLKPVHVSGSTSDRPLNAGQAISLDGVAQYIEIPYDAASPLFSLTTALTYEAWINPLSAGPLVARGQCNNAWPSAELSIGGSGPSFDLVFRLNAYNYEYYETFSVAAVLPRGKWSHVAATYDAASNSVRMYVNGTLVQSGVYYSQVWVPTTDLWIMGVPAPTPGCWSSATQGSVDEVRIWDIARTQEQIRQSMHGSLSASERHLVGYWRFDDANGSESADNSGEGHTAFLRNEAVPVNSGAEISTGKQFRPGKLVVSADDRPTSNTGFASAPSGSTAKFVTNLASYFTGGPSGRFLIYSNHETFGTQFRNTLLSAGHIVDQSLTPVALGTYKGIFVGGNTSMDADSLFDYLRQGGNLYVASGAIADTLEEEFWDAITSAYGIRLRGESGLPPSMNTSFLPHPVTNSVFGLYTENPSSMALPGGYLSRTQLLSSRGNRYNIALHDGTASELLPGLPILNSPPDGSSFTFTTQLLQWYANFTVVRYRLEVASDPAFSTIIKDTILTGNQATLSGLQRNTTHYWRVSAMTNAGIGRPTTPWSFRTVPDAPPGIPDLVTPADGVADVNISTIFRWRKAENASVYQIQLGFDSSFTSLAVNDSALVDSFRTIAGLLTNTLYYWRVRAINLEGEGEWSPRRSFVTERLPDLQIAEVQVASTAFSGQHLEIRWITANAGDGPTNVALWYDRLYLSPDSLFDPSLSIPLGVFQNSLYLGEGDTSLQTVTVTLANGLTGVYYIFAQSDIYNNMRERNESNNATRSTGLTITLTPPPDLQVTNIVTPANTFSGQPIDIYWNVRNLGVGPTRSSSWSDAVYLSQDQTFSTATDQRLAVVARFGELEVDSGYLARATVTIPHTVYGTWYLFVAADLNNTVYEFASEGNNVTLSDSIVVTLNPPPDLAVTEISAPPAGESGKELLVTWTVANEGLGFTHENTWRDAVYLSGSATFDSSLATLLGSVGHAGRLDADTFYRASLRATLPNGIDGTFYIHVKTDYLHQVFEHIYEANNVTLQDTMLTISLSPWPDLIVESVETQDTATAGQQVQVVYRVKNDGTAPTPSTQWYEYLYVSPNSYWDPQISRYLRTLTRTRALEPGEFYDRAIDVTLPSDFAGPYYFYIVTDATTAIYEHTSETNNVSGSNAIFVLDYPPIDLAVDTLAAPSSASSGDTILVEWGVENIGLGATTASTWMDILYLSTDSTFDPDADIILKSRERVGSLAAGASYTRSQQIVVPNGISGTFHLFMSADLENRTGDINLGNNYRRFPSPLVVALTLSADLAVTSVSATDSIDIGQPVKVHYAVSNTGPGAVRSAVWFDAVYLSEDSVLSSGDRRLGITGRSTPRDPASSYADSIEVRIPSVAEGVYALLLKTDNREDVYESNSETNNVGWIPLQITHPLPGDLRVTSSSFDDTVTVGEVTSVSWTLRNEGINPVSGYLTDAVYVSTDTSWNIDDPLLGISTHYISLQPGMAEVLSIKANLASIVSADSTGSAQNPLPGVAPGRYYIIVRTDIRNNITELDNDNNHSVSADRMTALVPELTIEVPLVTSLARGTERYYTLRTEAGEALEVLLRSTSLTASNELYVRFGAMPSRIAFDFVHSDPFEPNQEIIVPETREGTYYIMVRCDAITGSQTDTILARYIDYQVRSVKPARAGNSGEVTLRIEGARFNKNTTFSLVPTGVTDPARRIPAVRSAMVNTILYNATFDLTGIATGLYDLYTENRFTWVAADLADTSNITYGIRSVVDSTILAGALEVVEGADPRLEVRLATPGAVPVNRDFAITLEVFNSGNVDVKAPVVRVYSPTGVPLDLKPPVNTNAPGDRTLLILGPGERRDVFAPGDRALVRMFTRSPGRGTPFVRFISEDLSTAADVAINWDGHEASYRDSTPPDQWATTWTNFKLMAGSTFGELHNVMRNLALNRMPDPDQPFLFGSDLIQELLGLARNGVISMPSVQATESYASALSDFEFNRAIDSVNTLLKLGMPDHFSAAQHAMLCSGLIDSFDTQRNNPSIINDDKFCSECYTSYACVYGPLSTASAAIRAMWLLESARYARPYIILSYDRWADSEGDISYTEFDQIGADLKGCRAVRIRRDEIIDYALPRIRYFLRSDEFNCGQGLYNITDFVPTSVMNAGMDLGQEGVAAEHGLIRTLGGVSPEFSGYVTLVQVGSYPDGRKRFEVKFTLNLRIHDRYDFCPSSGVGAGMPFDFTFYLLRQAEKCGIVQPYYNTVEVDVPPRIRYLTCGGSNDGNDDDGDGDDGDGDDSPPSPPAPPDPDPDESDVPVLAPSDPNDILGPAGYGDRRWIGSGQTLEYTIRYENDPKKATAPAQVVTITHPLDSTADARTFRVGRFGFGSFAFDVPAGRAFYQTRLDVRDSLGLFIDVNAGIDITSNRAFWIFTSIDPSTGQQPLNPLFGYLLVNDSAGRGEGYVTYTVRPKRTIPSGSVLNAQARIIFDQEDPIDTPPIFNTIDAGIPSSAVATSLIRVDSVSYRLSWSGADDSSGSGLRGYSVYVSKDEEDYIPWIVDVPETSGVFVGILGARYRFYSIAGDNAGNIEPVPANPDLTFVVTGIGEERPSLPAEYALRQNFPNPFNPVTTVEYALPAQSRVTLTVFNVLGQRVRQLVDATEDAGYRAVVWDGRNDQGLHVSTGVYFYRIEAEPFDAGRRTFYQVRKMIYLK